MDTDSKLRLTAFFARQRALLVKERGAEIERSSLLLTNCSAKLLEQKGLALLGLGIVNINIGLGGKTLVELERPSAYHTSPLFPPHSLRTGDLARIEANVAATSKKAPVKAKAGASQDREKVEGVVYRVTDTRIVIAVDGSDSASEDLDLPERVRIVKLANSVTYDRMDKTIDQLERIVMGKSEEKISSEKLRLVQVLLAMSTRSPDTINPLPNLSFFDESLNPSQKDAVRFALQAGEVACIHGPPGTGKTHTLVEIIRQLTAVTPSNPKSLRVLVCGASNLSVDNILERLLALPVTDKGSRIKVTRIGHPARVMANADILDSTLEVKAGRSDQAILAKDVKNELETALSTLSGKGKGKPPRGAERRKMWDEVKALRKELSTLSFVKSDCLTLIRYRQREGGVVNSVLVESQVVIATCHSAGGRQLRNHEFDVVIIDEATQAMEAVCWVPILKGRKLILAGDPMQLPPTVLSIDKDSKMKPPKLVAKPTKKNEDKKAAPPPPPQSGSELSESDATSAEEGKEEAKSIKPVNSTAAQTKNKGERGPLLKPPRTLEITLFDRLEKMYGKQIKRMLQVQYRMHQDICTFPSKTLYGSKLASAPAVEKHLLLDLPETHADSPDDEKEVLATPVVFFDTAGCEYFERLEGDGDEGSRCNENEATVVKNWVDKLIGAGVLPSQIAVISPYQAQVTLLTSLIRPQYGAELEIGTVDGMQGREKEAVVISLVRSNDTREVGFLKEKRRLNVAMTRAKRHLCIVGDSSTVSYGGKYLKKWLGWLDGNADVRYAGLE
ncbi:AAA domain-containing protein [Mycena indigotica]|uniref:DNA helicase n=1 Tax=Mycena indigotica TaxID=2126181 RepID=A0A8H6S527_9AGAR|nr:AAA domain-containing protein [Mycena indigotica]KAF7293044.1 AAA domain-containing protein [Mycena indigotica]